MADYQRMANLVNRCVRDGLVHLNRGEVIDADTSPARFESLLRQSINKLRENAGNEEADQFSIQLQHAISNVLT